MDYYVVLGIAEDSSDATIRNAFRALARRYHPDVGEGSSLVEFQRAREAYETLVDPERRRRYDEALRASRAQPFIVEQLMFSRPFTEPLFGSRRTSFGIPQPWTNMMRSSFFEDVMELVSFLDDEWLHRR